MANINKPYGSLVKTAYGDTSGIAPNATVSVGETLAEHIDDPYKIHTNVVKQGKPGADDQLANVKDITYISSFADRVMNVNDPAFGQRYSDAVREPALKIENIRKTYDNVPTYAKQSSLYRITRKVQDDQVAKRIRPYQKRIEDLSEQQEIQDYVHNKNTYEATMAKCGKNRLPGFVDGNNPNQINTNFARIPSMGIIGMPPRYYNWMNKDFNDTIFTRNANGDLITGINYEWFPNMSSYLKSSANKPNTDFAKIPMYNPAIKNYTGIWNPAIPNPNKAYPELAAKIPTGYEPKINVPSTLPDITETGKKSKEDDRNPNARYTGWIPELATQAINLAAFLRHRNSDIMKPDIYHHNPYETVGLSRLANLRINNYPIAKEMRDAERRGAYQIRNAGTSPGQWANQRIALALGTQNNIAKLFSNNQMQNNAYQSDWAKSALAAGENTRNARMKANEYGWDKFIAAHGARELNSSKYMDAIAQTLGQGYSNWWKWNQWRDTMSRYDQAYDLENRKLKAYYGLS